MNGDKEEKKIHFDAVTIGLIWSIRVRFCPRVGNNGLLGYRSRARARGAFAGAFVLENREVEEEDEEEEY